MKRLRKLWSRLVELRWTLRRKWLEFCYRHQDPDVCCCGNDLTRPRTNYGCAWLCRSLKEYTITSQIERERKKK